MKHGVIVAYLFALESIYRNISELILASCVSLEMI